MKCDRCDNEATIHETLKVNGQLTEKHLCASCAKEDGIDIPTPVPVADFLQKFAAQMHAGAAARPAGPACERCSTSFAEFRQSGLLGCPDCYKSFEEKLGALLERAHEGASHHVGKAPRRASAARPEAVTPDQDVTRRVETIRRLLSEAVMAEQYERAARLRDELRNLAADPEGDLP